MKKNIKKIIAVVLILAMMMTMAGCTSWDNFKSAFVDKDDPADTGDTIRIGVFEPQTGEYKSQGALEIQGIELAHALYPEVEDLKIQLVYADNKSDIYDAEAALTELLNKDVSLIIGSYGETLTLIAAKKVKEAKIPGIAVTSTNRLITANNDYYFCATYTEDVQGEVLADYAADKLGATKIVALKISGDDTVTDTITRFTTEVHSKMAGAHIMRTTAIDEALVDYTDVINDMSKSGIEVVFLNLSAARAIDFMKQSLALEYYPVFMGTRGWDVPEMKSYVEDNPGLKVCYCSDAVETAENPVAIEFLRAYREKNGENAEPATATTLGFDAYLLAYNAIKSVFEIGDYASLDEYLEANGYGPDTAPVEPTYWWQDWTAYNEEMAARQMAITELTAKYTQVDVYMSSHKLPSPELIREALLSTQDMKGASGNISFSGTNQATKGIVVKLFYKAPVSAEYMIEDIDEDGNPYMREMTEEEKIAYDLARAAAESENRNQPTNANGN